VYFVKQHCGDTIGKTIPIVYIQLRGYFEFTAVLLCPSTAAQQLLLFVAKEMALVIYIEYRDKKL
jgi:hypothetical protein